MTAPPTGRRPADPAGSASYNNALSKRRAESVASYLTQAGVQGISMRTVGMGETRLVVEGAERDQPGAQANRRVVFVVETKGGDATTASIPRATSSTSSSPQRPSSARR